MSIITQQLLSKVSLGCLLASAILVTGCNDTSTTDDTVSANDTTMTEPEVGSAKNVTSNSDDSLDDPSNDLVMTTITLDTVDQMLFVPLMTNGDLSAEQVSCLESRDNDLGKVEVDTFYKGKFTEAELASLDTFYSSEVGQKLLAFGSEQLLIMNGQEVASPMPDPTPDEMTEIQSFMESPLGAKYMEINNAEGPGSAMEVLNVPLNAEFERCNIDLVL